MDFSLLLIGLIAGFFISRFWDRAIASSPDSTSSPDRPPVVVNVPADYKPLQTLDGKEVVVGEKAVLYWTVLRAAMDELSSNGGYLTCTELAEAREAADAAVDKVFPP